MHITTGGTSVVFAADRHHKREVFAEVAAGLDNRRETEDELVAAWYLRERGQQQWLDGRAPADIDRIERERSG